MVVSKKEIERLTQDAVQFINGRKAVEKILDNFKAQRSGKRSGHVYIESEDAVREKGLIFNTDFRILTDLDASVLPLQRDLQKAKAQYKNELNMHEGRHSEIRSRAAQSDERVDRAKSEMSALNKLISGLKNLLGIFTGSHAQVAEEEQMAFMDAHFDLEQIIRSKVSAEATLTFTPPEYYNIAKDMMHQLERLHGVEPQTE